jgi:hypothetical protein
MEQHGPSDLLPKLQLNSLVESEGGRKQIKIRNFQALIDDNYNHNSMPNKIFQSSLVTNSESLSKALSDQLGINEEELIQ